MPPVAILAVVAVGAAVAGTMSQMKAAKKQQKAARRMEDAQRDQQRIEQARANVLAQRDRIQAIREERIRRSDIIAGAGQAGMSLTGGSSGLAGATSSVRSQVGQNLGTLGSMQSFGEQLSASRQREADAESDYRTAGAKGQMWQSIFSTVGGVAQTGLKAMGGGAGGAAGGGGTLKGV
ncbi:hypothetical protein SAMN05216299_1356 [Nitrosospira sp. Nsp14]|uniref:hypothetical protein n=1 Tax=Nitrosospira sp. Nsp14 TaxID=1855333 RepID=UPI0008F41FE0|nr:hypothetical protein [Nitrosospira sp. Nsp14]SFH61264.1 hypothetical protein SAMN05216299_1356 [Nitrosospira sp. Nsp14]